MGKRFLIKFNDKYANKTALKLGAARGGYTVIVERAATAEIVEKHEEGGHTVKIYDTDNNLTQERYIDPRNELIDLEQAKEIFKTEEEFSKLQEFAIYTKAEFKKVFGVMTGQGYEGHDNKAKYAVMAANFGSYYFKTKEEAIEKLNEVKGKGG